MSCCICLFRVKELGPGGPVEGKPANVLPPSNDASGALSPQNSDLALLRTTNVSSISSSSNVCHVQDNIRQIGNLTLLYKAPDVERIRLNRH